MVHRADLSKTLSNRALNVGVKICFQARVASVLDGPEQITVKLEDGKTFTSDVLIGADGQYHLHWICTVNPKQQS